MPRIVLMAFILLGVVTGIALAQQDQQNYQTPYGQQQGYQAPYGQQQGYQNPYGQQAPYGQQQGYQNPYGQQQGYQNPYGQQAPAVPSTPYPSQGDYNQNPYGQQQGGTPAASLPGGALRDALGRFTIAMPQGAVPFTAVYSFMVPTANCQVSIMSAAQDQALQMNLQSFPNMVQSMGGQITAQQDQMFGAKRGRLVTATMNDPQTRSQVVSMNAFLLGSGVWVQVMAPAQAQGQAQQLLNQIVNGVQ